MNMSVTFEHSSIREALIRTGLKILSFTSDTLPSTQHASVLIAWSDRDTLLLRPEYAWLSLKAVTFIQLPQQSNFLRQQIEDAQQTPDVGLELEILCTPLGQWRWALGELQESLNRADEKESFIRLMELRRFATKHWPGWYEKTFTDIRDAIDINNRSSDLLLDLLSNADAVATLEACGPLLNWTEGGTKGSRIVPLEDAACYASQGVGEIKVIAELAATDPWWSELETDLSTTEATLHLVRKGGGEPESILGNRLVVLRRCIAEISNIEESSFSLSREEICNFYSIVSTLQRTLVDIVKLYNNVRVLASAFRREV